MEPNRGSNSDEIANTDPRPSSIIGRGRWLFMGGVLDDGTPLGDDDIILPPEYTIAEDEWSTPERPSYKIVYDLPYQHTTPEAQGHWHPTDPVARATMLAQPNDNSIWNPHLYATQVSSSRADDHVQEAKPGGSGSVTSCAATPPAVEDLQDNSNEDQSTNPLALLPTNIPPLATQSWLNKLAMESEPISPHSSDRFDYQNQSNLNPKILSDVQDLSDLEKSKQSIIRDLELLDVNPSGKSENGNTTMGTDTNQELNISLSSASFSDYDPNSPSSARTASTIKLNRVGDIKQGENNKGNGRTTEESSDNSDFQDEPGIVELKHDFVVIYIFPEENLIRLKPHLFAVKFNYKVPDHFLDGFGKFKYEENWRIVLQIQAAGKLVENCDYELKLGLGNIKFEGKYSIESQSTIVLDMSNCFKDKKKAYGGDIVVTFPRNVVNPRVTAFAAIVELSGNKDFAMKRN